MSITITISGNGGAFGVGNISEEQYSYWINNEENMLDAFQQNLDQSDIPEDAQIEDYYDAFNDVESVYGLYEDELEIQITDAKNNLIFRGSYSDFYDYCNTVDSDHELITEHTELYVPFMEDDWGYFLYWRNYQKGIFINCVVSDDDFDPKKITFSSCDLNGQATLITEAMYDSAPLDIDLSGMTSLSVECSLHFNE